MPQSGTVLGGNMITVYVFIFCLLHVSEYLNCICVISEKCGAQFFQCSNGACIMKRYVCDGYHDCKGGEDESVSECGMYVTVIYWYYVLC